MSTENNRNEMTRIIRCPRCGTFCRYDLANENRPFCSVPCKNHDIVNWAEGTYRVPGPPALEIDQDSTFMDEEE